MNRISVLFFLVDLCFYYLFILEIGKLRVMCSIPLTLRWSEYLCISKIDIDWVRLIRGSTYKYKSEVLFKTDTCKVLHNHIEV